MSQANTKQTLEQVLNNPAIWRADQGHARYPGIPTTFPALDQALPDAGWPAGVLTELLVRETGAGELSLLLPALRAICAEERGIALLAPPYLPHARAWEAAGIALERLLVVDSTGVDLLWATEQILRSGECGAVLAWGQAAGRALNHRALQRLHLAAGAGNALCFLYRSFGAADAPSPAPLRIRLAAHAGALHLHLVKCRGMTRTKPLLVELFPAHWQPSPVRVLPAAPSAATASHAIAPVSIEAREHEVDETILETSRIPATTHLQSIELQTSSATLSKATADLCAVTVELAASSFATSGEGIPATTSRNTAGTQAFSEPAFVAAAPQWIAGGATIASGSAPLSGAAAFPAVHSRTSVA